MNKKAISPVIAISLLVIVSVVAVIGYQSWFNSYEANNFIKIEQKSSQTKGGIDIQYLSKDGFIFIKNSYSENKSMNSIKVGDVDCNINQTLEPGINSIDISSCLSNSGTNNIVILTNEEIIEEKLFVDKFADFSPFINFISNTTNLKYGEDINLSWSVSNLDSCIAQDDWSGSKDLSSSQIITNIKNNKTYTLNCTGKNGDLIRTLKINITDFSSCIDIRNGLSGLWHFDQNVLDFSFNANHGTNTGASSIAGKVGNAYSFDGNLNQVLFGSGYKHANTFTFGAWVKTSFTHQIDGQSTGSTGGTSGQKYVFVPANQGNTNSGAGISVGTNGISVYEHGTSYMPPLAVYSSSIGSGWNHIVIVYNNKQPKIYLNGNLVHTGLTSPRSNVYSPYELSGSYTYGPFNGQIDEVFIYNRALSGAEISTMYTGSNSGKEICNP